jgi:hypothetical protein
MKLRLAATFLLVLALLLNLLWVAVNVGDLRDYGSFIAAGKAIEDGDNPYGVYEYTYIAHLGGQDIDSPNLNPPASLYAFRLMAEVNPYTGKLLLNIATSISFVLVVLALLRDAGRKLTPGLALWLVSLAGFWHIIELGQIYFPLLAALTCAWIVQDKRPLLAGLLIGLTIAIKPNFAVWPMLLFLAGDRKTSISAFATAAGVSVLPLVSFGTDVYSQWLKASSEFSGGAIPNNASIISIFARAGLTEVGLVASACVLLLAAFWAFVARPSRREAAAAGLVIALALGPITWSGYTLFALPVLLDRSWRGCERAAAATLVVPVPIVLILGIAGTAGNLLVGSVYGWGLLILLGLLARDAIVEVRTSALPQPSTRSDSTEALAA